MQVTWWLWQFRGRHFGQPISTYEQLAVLVRNRTPAEYEAGLMVKAHSGRVWQDHWDTHPLAINGQAALYALGSACAAEGVKLGTWGEARNDFKGSGIRAAEAARASGYYALDLEPYSDFGYSTIASPGGEAAVMWEAREFWAGYSDGGGAQEVGVSVAPQPSGIEPFGTDGLREWLLPCANVHAQDYWSQSLRLHPNYSHPYLQDVFGRLQIDRVIIPIVESANLYEWLGSLPAGAYAAGVDVWAA